MLDGVSVTIFLWHSPCFCLFLRRPEANFPSGFHFPMKIKSITLAVIATTALATVSGQAATLVLIGAGGLGATLDGATSGTYAVPEISGLTITVVSVSSNAASGDALNSTATSFGINDGASGDDTDEFDAGVNEVATFSFNKDVTITLIDFVNFGSDDAFNFAGQAIAFSDLSSSDYTFSTPLEISANTSFSLSATLGTAGIRGIELTAVPEPSTALLGAFGMLALLRRRR